MANIGRSNLCLLNFVKEEPADIRNVKLDNPDLTQEEIDAISNKMKEHRENKTALHIAFYDKDTPNVENILKYMAMSGENSSSNFRDILHQLIDYKNIMGYLESSLLQTDFMASKTVYSRVVKNSKKFFAQRFFYPEPRLDE